MPKTLDRIAVVLAAVGAVNWGLVAAFKFHLVAALAGEEFGRVNPVSRAVYGAVGLAGLALLAGRAAALGEDRPAG